MHTHTNRTLLSRPREGIRQRRSAGATAHSRDQGSVRTAADDLSQKLKIGLPTHYRSVTSQLKVKGRLIATTSRKVHRLPSKNVKTFRLMYVRPITL